MTTGSRNWRAPILLAALSTLCTVAVIALVGEWAVRHRERSRTSVPGTMSKLFYQHSRLRHVPVRGTDYFGWVHIGKQGFRGARNVTVARPDSVFRILAVGGSTTFDGNTSADSSTWPARLEQLLDSIAAPVRFEVLNAGVPGYQIFDDLIRLETELHRYSPDVIILYQGHNDLFTALSRAGRSAGSEFEPRPGEIPTVYPWVRWLEQNSLLYHKFRSRFRVMAFRSSGNARRVALSATDYQESVRQATEDYGRTMGWFLAVAGSIDARVLIPQPVYAARSAGTASDSTLEARWRVAIPFAPTSEIRAGYARFDSVAKATASAMGALYIPASDSLLWRVDGYASGDPIHFSDTGAWRFAHHVKNVIVTLPEVAALRMP